MAVPAGVGDPDDDRLVDDRHLTDAELRRAHEDGAGVCVVEGELVVRRRSPSAPGWARSRPASGARGGSPASSPAPGASSSSRA